MSKNRYFVSSENIKRRDIWNIYLFRPIYCLLMTLSLANYKPTELNEVVASFKVLAWRLPRETEKPRKPQSAYPVCGPLF
jgi:hypothetical protein